MAQPMQYLYQNCKSMLTWHVPPDPFFAFRRYQCIQGRAGVFKMNHARYCFLLPDRLCDSQLLHLSILSCSYRLQLTFWWQVLLDRRPCWTTSVMKPSFLHTREDKRRQDLTWHEKTRQHFCVPKSFHRIAEITTSCCDQKTNKQSHGVLTMLRRVGGYERASAF